MCRIASFHLDNISYLFKVTGGLHRILSHLQTQALPKPIDPLSLLYPPSFQQFSRVTFVKGSLLSDTKYSNSEDNLLPFLALIGSLIRGITALRDMPWLID